jgi:hypothetical protein
MSPLGSGVFGRFVLNSRIAVGRRRLLRPPAAKAACEPQRRARPRALGLIARAFALRARVVALRVEG